MRDDKSARIERDVQFERKPNASLLFRLFAFAFSSTKTIGCIYLGFFILLSLLRPLLAYIWGEYIQTTEDLSIGATIIPAVLLIIGYFIINFIAEMINRYVNPLVYIERLDLVQANRQQELLHSRMYKKLADISPEMFEIPKINDRIAQVFTFVSDQDNGINKTVMLQSYLIIAKIVSIISIAASLYIFNPWLCLIVLIAPLPTLWSLTIGQRLRFKFIKENTKLARQTEYFQGLMLSPASKELKTLGLYDFFFTKWKDAADEYTNKERKLIRAQSILQIANSLMMSLTNVSGSVFAIILLTMGRITLGALGAVMSLVSTLVNDSKELLAGFATFFMKKNEAAQFFDLMELPGQKVQGDYFNELRIIEARKLKYRYPLTERYVLDDVNLVIRQGEKIAFVGENGMGKTTFVKILTGIISPSEGELLINNVEVEQINITSLYSCLSTVMQDPSRYTTFSIADNVFLGDTSKPRNECFINEALEFSGMNDIDKNDLLGKDIGGIELSGGQWQKLAIARSVYRNNNFIILDEPTSNLDPLAEADILKKYIAMTNRKTVIFVTHRISVASLADRIIVFSDGKIVQDGTHEELTKYEGEYLRLYNEQAKWYDR